MFIGDFQFIEISNKIYILEKIRVDKVFGLKNFFIKFLLIV